MAYTFQGELKHKCRYLPCVLACMHRERPSGMPTCSVVETSADIASSLPDKNQSAGRVSSLSPHPPLLSLVQSLHPLLPLIFHLDCLLHSSLHHPLSHLLFSSHLSSLLPLLSSHPPSWFLHSYHPRFLRSYFPPSHLPPFPPSVHHVVHLFQHLCHSPQGLHYQPSYHHHGHFHV